MVVVQPAMYSLAEVTIAFLLQIVWVIAFYLLVEVLGENFQKGEKGKWDFEKTLRKNPRGTP